MGIVAGRYRFGPFVLDRAAYRLFLEGQPVALSPKLVDLLLYFVTRPALLVSKDELLGAIWPDVTVTENALSQAVSDLRSALGDDSTSPRYIQTVARRGYRFVAPVEPLCDTDAREPALVGGASVSAEPGVVKSVAVLDFVNVSGDPELAWLSTGIAETVTNDLNAFHVLRVVDRVRVGEAVRRTGGSTAAVADALGVQLVVVGGLQRAGDRLRITARLVEAASGATLADAKVDGRFDEVFDLQDRVVRQFSAALGVETAYGRTPRVGVRETSNLEAFRAASEARVKLDSLDPSQLLSAVESFERAVRLDPRYAIAYAGLANAHFFVYEATRAQNQPDTERLTTAIGHARRAIDLDDTMAEGHATLSLLLVGAGRLTEAAAAARRAVALDPQDWRHLFRLGHAAWGSERLDALKRATAIYGDMAYAHYEMAMVHIARHRLEEASNALRRGIELQDRQAGRSWRYPSSGLHWLFGVVKLAQGQAKAALGEFERELQAGSAGRVYGAENLMNAHDGRGFALLAAQKPREARQAFERALTLYPGHARSHLGVAAAHVAEGDKNAAHEALAHAEHSIAELERMGKRTEAPLLEAMAATVRGRHTDALALLDHLLAESPPGYPGWTIPVEPLFKPLQAQPEFGSILARLAARAR
ncbi:MAG: winged helix-turn-helix domain-containing protein [Acidobacteriota bacterium]